LERLATTVGMSAAVTSFSAEVRFCVWLLMTLDALCNRLTVDPILPRRAATVETAVLMSVKAACASDWVNRSLIDPAAPPVNSALAKVLAADPVVVEAIVLPARPVTMALKVTVLRPAAFDPVAAVTLVFATVLLE